MIMIKRVNKAWGYEEWIVNNELYCFKKLFVKKGYRCSIHWHKNKDETFYVESGIVKIEEFARDPVIVTHGYKIRIKPNTLHRFEAIEDTMIYEVSTHHEDNDSYRVVMGGKVS